ncbi:MAG TPA: hypothetical protein VF665_08830 [Longimicrobium sp.]|jgi:hypothetical protein|uniref:hypothetical protein n=1 Tax=Longimicrobium sp. TaxID=2029185 RepID=UPI002ED78A10
MPSSKDNGPVPVNNKNRNRAALLLGAAGLFMFIVGVKRRHKLDAEREITDARYAAAEQN